MELLGYSLVAGVALAGAAAARLQKTGELAAKTPFASFVVVVLGVFYAVTGLSAVFYFSWAHLRWPHLVAFFVVALFCTGGIARTQSKPLVWATFVGSTAVALFSEAAILLE